MVSSDEVFEMVRRQRQKRVEDIAEREAGELTTAIVSAIAMRPKAFGSTDEWLELKVVIKERLIKAFGPIVQNRGDA